MMLVDVITEAECVRGEDGGEGDDERRSLGSLSEPLLSSSVGSRFSFSADFSADEAEFVRARFDDRPSDRELPSPSSFQRGESFGRDNDGVEGKALRMRLARACFVPRNGMDSETQIETRFDIGKERR
jgi:hypothetical protein